MRLVVSAFAISTAPASLIRLPVRSNCADRKSRENESASFAGVGHGRMGGVGQQTRVSVLLAVRAFANSTAFVSSISLELLNLCVDSMVPGLTRRQSPGTNNGTGGFIPRRSLRSLHPRTNLTKGIRVQKISAAGYKSAAWAPWQQLQHGFERPNMTERISLTTTVRVQVCCCPPSSPGWRACIQQQRVSKANHRASRTVDCDHLATWVGNTYGRQAIWREAMG